MRTSVLVRALVQYTDLCQHKVELRICLFHFVSFKETEVCSSQKMVLFQEIRSLDSNLIYTDLKDDSGPVDILTIHSHIKITKNAR